MIFLCSCANNKVELPKAVNGVLDLTGFDIGEIGQIKVDGQWEFYDKQLIEPKDLDKYSDIFKEVGQKTGVLKFDQSGTYSILVKLKSPEKLLHLNLNSSIFTNHKLWIDNTLVDAKFEETQISRIRDPIVNKVLYVPQKDSFRITLNLSNSLYNKISGISLETQKNYENRIVSDLIRNSIIYVSIIALGIYHFALFLFRRKDKLTFYFGLYCTVVTTHMILKDFIFNGTIYSISKFKFWANLDMLVMNVSGIIIMLYIIKIFQTVHLRKMFKYTIVMSAIFSLYIIIEYFWEGLTMKTLPLRLFIVNGTFLAAAIFALIIVIKAVKKKEVGAMYIIYAISLAVFSLIVDILSANGVIGIKVQTIGYGILILLFLNAVAIAKKFSMAFESVEELSEKLLSLDKLKDEFLANTSHELRTPINGIIGIAESLIDGATGKLYQKTVENLQIIVSSSKRLASLVNDILDFSKLKNADIYISQKNVDLMEISNLVIVISKTLISEKNIEIKNEIPENIPLVLADESRLQQIMYNLVGNAIKFTHEGSVTINAKVNGEYVEVSVTDTGIGIPKDKFDAIFKTFEQVDSSTSREYGGTGLGLSITKQLIELHGGKIWLESEVGKGSNFTFSLPVSQNQEINEASVIESKIMQSYSAWDLDNNHNDEYKTEIVFSEIDQVSDQSEADKVKILVVDDENVNLQVLVNQLSLEDYSVITAHNGIEALKILENGEKFDLILLDVMMPKMSGYEVCNILRKNYSLIDLPVLMLTAKNQPEDIIAGFDSGANDYLLKPFDKKELLARTKTLVLLKQAVKNAISNVKKFETERKQRL
ncbi:MAG: hypothetical protein C0412_18860, partial [Flavobacterium sp.]|nr:hypothetical protein [Flavobacterium sp.]